MRIPDPEGTLHAFPHQFSGGMRQRIAIAVALACRPKLLIADEPTTALDVTVQAGILRLLDTLRRETGLSVILITHDLGVMSSIADSVSVFYAGRIVESGATSEVLGRPRHPYTRALLDALPHPEGSADRELVAIAGTPPTPAGRPSGCAFHPRCPYAQPSCVEHVPPLVPIGDGRLLACPIDPFAPAMTLLDLRDVEVVYGRHGRHPVRAVAGASLDGRARPDHRPRRRVGLREVVARARRRRARRALGGRGAVRGPAADAARPRRTPGARGAAADGLPEPVRVAQPAPAHRHADRARR